MTSHSMTSSQCSWPAWTSKPAQQQCVLAPDCVDTGSSSTPQHFRSCDLVAAKTASFRQRLHEIGSVGASTGLVFSACEAYCRWSAAVETERRARGQPDHHEAMFDDIHARLIDIVEAALQRSSSDLVTGLMSLTVINASPCSSNLCRADMQTLLQRLTNSLQTARHQQVTYTYRRIFAT